MPYAVCVFYYQLHVLRNGTHETHSLNHMSNELKWLHEKLHSKFVCIS